MVEAAQLTDKTPDPGMSLGILLVDRHPLVLQGLASLIGSRRQHWHIIGQCADIDEAIALAVDTHPEVIVLGLATDRERFAARVAQLAAASHARVLLISYGEEAAVVDAALMAGASGVFRLDESLDSLLKAIDRIHAGELWLDRAATARLFSQVTHRHGIPCRDSPAKLIAQLTRRELTIIATLANHASTRNRKLAELLSVSEHTLRNHLCSIYDKLGLTGRVDLYAFAKQHGLDRSSH